MLINTKISAIRYEKRKWFSLVLFFVNVVISYFFHDTIFFFVISGASVVSVGSIFFRKTIWEISQKWEKLVHNWKGKHYLIGYEIAGWGLLFSSLFLNIYLIFPNPNTYTIIISLIFILLLLNIISLDNEK